MKWICYHCRDEYPHARPLVDHLIKDHKEGKKQVGP